MWISIVRNYLIGFFAYEVTMSNGVAGGYKGVVARKTMGSVLIVFCIALMKFLGVL